VLILKEEERGAFKKPFGEIYSSVAEIKETLENIKTITNLSFPLEMPPHQTSLTLV